MVRRSKSFRRPNSIFGTVGAADMKEDILEQLVDDYLQSQGYFTRHNLKFRPRNDHTDFVSNQDSNHSDIDVLGYHPLRSGPSRVMAVSCKSWQVGFNVQTRLTCLEGN